MIGKVVLTHVGGYDPNARTQRMTAPNGGPDNASGEVGRVVTPGYGRNAPKPSGPRHDKPGVTKSPAPKVPTHPQKGGGGKGRGGKRGR